MRNVKYWTRWLRVAGCLGAAVGGSVVEGLVAVVSLEGLRELEKGK